ncbi:glycoside hydrolase family 43 protein [Zopfia rhizophila CBS 207.26]|uniref:Glycoside hydrolase family 43 protein n=1 Tax=Zopfia rhizophila CBS 207.26 TaxID=1314779 RepID=A0A6A6E7A1_9PEZI|nr:glycoside hydrolase family 43 protein [Zopfia rhizophila CBS 207.26]
MFPGQHGQWHPPVYNDRILTITDATTPDPYVIWDNGVYYMTFTAGDRVEIWSADSLFDFERRAQKHVIWRPPPNTPYSGDLWAPELHSLQGRWYVYFAADDPVHGNKSHRMYVLAGPPSDHSPVSPNSWTFEGRLQGLPEDQWAIDGTVITLHGGLCFVYSGWPLGVTNDESKQEIFIIEMETPTMCIGQPIRISTPDNPWEYSGSSGINEGPQFLQSPDRRWIGLVYSCAGSWTHEYKMNLLQYTGSHPSHILHQQYWKKSRAPLLKASSDDTPPYGPGHGNFVVVSGPSGVPEVWAVFHATDAKTGWDGRKARVMRVGWGQEGPFMGSGECGSCGDVNYFLGYEGERSHGGGDGGQEQGIKGEPRGLVGEAKRLLNTFLK